MEMAERTYKEFDDQVSEFGQRVRLIGFLTIFLFLVLLGWWMLLGGTAFAELAKEMPATGSIGKLSSQSCKKVHVVTFEIRESSFSLNLFTHLKNKWNATAFVIPVTEDYYKTLKVGDKIVDDFRYGGLIIKGKIGDWQIIVKKKEIFDVCQ